MAKRVSLVTGGSGFIGRHLVRQLLARCERVRIFDVADPPPSLSGAEYLEGAILDRDKVTRALNGVHGVHCVYHLAANPNLWSPCKSEFEDVNWRGTEIVFEQAARVKVERIVYCSTESILKSPSHRLAAPLADAEPGLTIENVPGPYCRSKFLAEQRALEAAKRGLPVVVVNPTLPVGPGDRFLTPPTRMLALFLNGGTPAYLDFDFNMIDVRDAALGHILAAERGRIGERYILRGENLRLATLLQMLEELSGLPMPRTRIPYWLAFAFASVSEFVADRVTHRYRAAPVSGVRLARTPSVFDSSKAARELGLPIHGVRQALADAIDWLAANGHLKRRVRASRVAIAVRL